MCVVTYNLDDGDTDRREILHYAYISAPDMIVFSPLGAVHPKDPKNSKFCRLESEYLKNGKSQRYVPI